MYEILILWVRSDILPCRIGRTAPPSIAIISPLPPIFVSGPKLLTEIPNIVGNISDMNPEISTKATTAGRPFPNITKLVESIANIADIESKILGLIYFIRIVKTNLANTNKISAAI